MKRCLLPAMMASVFGLAGCGSDSTSDSPEGRRNFVVVLVDELENADLIARNRVKGDRRSYALRATLKGRRAWAKAEALVHAHEARLFAALAPEDRERLHALLLAIDRATD